MIPQFPEFKKIDINDQEAVESHTHRYPPYSDFEFGSLYAWDIDEAMKVSIHNGNLVIRFTDYVTKEPFYTFLGTKDVNETAQDLLRYSDEQGFKPVLKLIPETVANKLDLQRFTVSVDRDNFDYIYSTSHHSVYHGSEFKNLRNQLTMFLKRYLHHTVNKLELSDIVVCKEIRDLCKRWADTRIITDSHDSLALERFIHKASQFRYLAIGIKIDAQLIAFSITTLLSEKYGNCLFAKADINFHGSYSILMNETSKALVNQGYDYLNFEQDLGIPNMRRAKLSLNPINFLRKYQVRTA